MHTTEKQELVKKPEVVEEIKKHLWIESQKAGRDLGYDFAAKDWLDKFADAWMAKHGCAKPCPTTSKKSKAFKCN